MSNIANFVKGSLITCFAINSKWVTLHICERGSHYIFFYDQQPVSYIVYLVKGSLITSFHMTNSLWVTLQIWWKVVSSHLFIHMTYSKWVTLHIWWKAVSSHLLLWPTVCEWHCMFWKGNLFYDKQDVSDILHILGKVVSSHLLLWLTASERHIAHFMNGSLITSFAMTNSLWVTLHILWKAVSTSFPMTNSWWVTYCMFCERQSHQIFSYDQ